MMMHRRILALSAAFGLAFSGVSAQTNRAHQLLQQESEDGRTIALAGVVESTGERCSGVGSQYLGTDSDQAAYYRVDCRNRPSFMVQIAADSGGSTRVLACSLIAALGIDCFKPF